MTTTDDRRLVVLDVERILSHQLAHAVGNSLGAMGVLLDMLRIDVQDPAVLKRIDSLAWAVRLAAGNVNALRFAIPKPEQDTGAADFSFLIDTVHLMLGDMAPRLDVSGLGQGMDVRLLGDRAIMVYVLYHLSAHVLGAVSGRVFLSCSLRGQTAFAGERIFGDDLEDQDCMAIGISSDERGVNPMMVDPDLWTEICDDQGCSVFQSDQGFQVIWPSAGE